MTRLRRIATASASWAAALTWITAATIAGWFAPRDQCAHCPRTTREVNAFGQCPRCAHAGMPPIAFH